MVALRHRLDPFGSRSPPFATHPDFLLRAAGSDHECGLFLKKDRMTLINATDLNRKSGAQQ
jgi:hypothetical protein